MLFECLIKFHHVLLDWVRVFHGSFWMFFDFIDWSSTQEMLLLLGKVLASGSWTIQGITFDGHNAHAYIKECLYGHFEKLDQNALAEVPFWSSVRYEDLPHHCLPHLPLKICMVDDEPIWPLAGPCILDVLWLFFDIFWLLDNVWYFFLYFLIFWYCGFFDMVEGTASMCYSQPFEISWILLRFFKSS